MNIFRVDLPSGSITQLTDEKWHVRDFVLCPDDEQVIYWGISEEGRRSVKALRLADLSERVIYEVPEGWSFGSQIGLSSDAQFAVVTEMWESDQVENPTGWEYEAEQWAKSPRCRIVMMATDGSESWVVLEDKCWIQHTQLRPGDHKTIFYRHEGPIGKIDARIWLVNDDGSYVRCPRPQTTGEEIQHEYWLADGSKIAYVRYPPAETWHERRNAATIRFLDTESMREEVSMHCPGCSHFFSDKNNSKIVRDSNTDPFIYLIDVGARKEIRLCRHDTSWEWYGDDSQAAHPHPSFSPDGSRVIFSSDKDGLPAVYLVELTGAK
jgi:oligogalacturonide lyase